MATRTITLNDMTTVEPAAGNKLIVRENGSSIEVMRPPTGAVRFLHSRRNSTLSFGSPNGAATLVLNGPDADLRHLFDALTGVKP